MSFVLHRYRRFNQSFASDQARAILFFLSASLYVDFYYYSIRLLLFANARDNRVRVFFLSHEKKRAGPSVRSLFFYPLCLLHGDIRRVPELLQAVVAHLQLFFNFPFPYKTKKYSLCTLRGTRVSLHIWRKTEIVTSVFARTVFPMFRILSPSLASCSPLSPFSSLLLLFLFLSASGFFRISSPSLTCYFCFQICHSHLRPFSPATPSPTPHNPLVVVTPELRSSPGYFDFVRSITQREFLSCGVSSRLFFPAIITTTASTSHEEFLFLFLLLLLLYIAYHRFYSHELATFAATSEAEVEIESETARGEERRRETTEETRQGAARRDEARKKSAPALTHTQQQGKGERERKRESYRYYKRLINSMTFQTNYYSSTV